MGQGSAMQITRLAAGFSLRPAGAAFSKRAAGGLALLAMLAGLTGCQGFFTAIKTTTTGTGSTTYAYITNNTGAGTSGTLTAYSLTSGVLTQLSGSPISLPAAPTSIVVAPNNAFLYVGTQLGIFLYTINSDGTLTEGNTDTLLYLGPTYPVKLAVDATSSWLIVASNNSTELDALPIDPTTGLLTSATPVTATLSYSTPEQIALSPANTSVFVALGTGGTEVCAFSPAKSNPWGSSCAGVNLAKGSSTANAVAADTTSTYLFIAESTGGATADLLRQVKISSLGGEVDYATGKGPSAILPDLSGDYVYVANETDSSISGFSISAGALTPLTDSPFATAKSPVAMAEDSTKSYVLDVGLGNNPNLWIYSFDGTSLGTLDVTKTATTGSTDPSLSNAIALTH